MANDFVCHTDYESGDYHFQSGNLISAIKEVVEMAKKGYTRNQAIRSL